MIPSNLILPFQKHLYVVLLGMGFPGAVADEIAWQIVKFMGDPVQVRMAPHAFLHPGNMTASFSAAINSDRVRHQSGVTVILDMPAVFERFQVTQ